jgi:hypothetical protein
LLDRGDRRTLVGMKGVACLASLVVVSLSLGACGNYQTEVAKNTESIAAAFVDPEISMAEKRIHGDIRDNRGDLPATVSDYIARPSGVLSTRDASRGRSCPEAQRRGQRRARIVLRLRRGPRPRTGAYPARLGQRSPADDDAPSEPRIDGRIVSATVELADRVVRSDHLPWPEARVCRFSSRFSQG